ncbi:MAG: alpha/beta hydrolase [Bacillota bacterium]|nr:alpha/beta hydrolase [Bacillota bacterium]
MSYAKINGFDMYYEVMGDGEPVVFVHGVGVTSRMWEFQKKAFSKEFKMIIFDLRGSGKSSKTPEVYHTAELLCEDLKGLLDFLNIKIVNIVGLSLGAAIAMKFAVEYPDSVKSLVISGAFIDFKRILSFTSRHFCGIIGKLLMTRVFGEMATRIMLPSVSRKGLLYYHKNIINIDRDEVIKYEQILKSYSITPALSKIKAKTLLVYGSRELPFHKYGRAIHKYVKDSVMMIIPGVGHGWNGERPELFNKIVIDFIKSAQSNLC